MELQSLAAGTDNGAVLDGYTVEKIAESSDGTYSLHISHKPDADYDSRLRVFCHDEQRFIVLNAWNWTFEDVE